MSRVISTNPVDQIWSLEDDLVRVARDFGLTLKYSPAQIGPRLNSLSAQKLNWIAGNMRTVLENLSACQAQGLDPWDDREFFALSMRSMGLTFPKGFVDTIMPGDLLEGYDMNRHQTFRNMRFMECSGYSLLQILSHEWTELYVRPSIAQGKMISYIDEILWKENQTIPFDVPVHYIRELMSSDKQIFEVTFKKLTPLFSGPDQPYGLIGSCAVQLADKEKVDRDNVAFI